MMSLKGEGAKIVSMGGDEPMVSLFVYGEGCLGKQNKGRFSLAHTHECMY
jgi:hypothetical protein